MKDIGAYTVTQFCESHQISRAFFYLLIKRGLAPRVASLGGKRLITKEAAEEWRKALSGQEPVR